jgi:hypothetical protein
MKRCFLLVAIGCCAVHFSGICGGREYGPEWTPIRDSNGKVIEYHKQVNVPVVHFPYGAVANYDVQLEWNRLHITEIDRNKGFSIRSAKYGYFEVSKNPDGASAWHLIRFPKVQYWDLNGDGVLDVMQRLYDGRSTDSVLAAR